MLNKNNSEISNKNKKYKIHFFLMTNAASYIYSAYSFISELPLDKLLEVGNHSKDGNPIPSFEESILIDLCSEAQQIFQSEDIILEIDGDMVIVGDIHGSFHDLLRILNFVEENHSKVLFLGDYVDRGHFSLECITLLFAMKVMRPDYYFLIRGNHEFDSLCSQYGFKDEIIDPLNLKPDKCINTDSKETDNNCQNENKKLSLFHSNPNSYSYTEKLYDAFIKAFSYLPICAVVNKSAFCIHGGLSPRLKTVDSIRQINRPIQSFEENQLLTNALWSDPSTSKSSMYAENQRGRGYLFNIDVVFNFLKTNSLQRIIRGHQCVTQGYHEHFHSLCITVFSASSYARDMGNYSGIIKLNQKDDRVEFIKFFPLHQIKKIDAVFYKVKISANNNINNDANKPKCFSVPHPNARISSKLSINKNMNKFAFIPNGSDSGCQKVVRLPRHPIFGNPRKTNPIVKINSLYIGHSMKLLDGNHTKKMINQEDIINHHPIVDLKNILSSSDDAYDETKM